MQRYGDGPSGSRGVTFGITDEDRMTTKEEIAENWLPRYTGTPTGMLGDYIKGPYDLANSFVIGDRATDVQLARNLGAKAIYLTSAYSDRETEAELKPNGWKEIYEFLVARN